ncbi:MAG: BREX system P-loop protein BrxC, partial [Actinomycetota bacterium]
ARAAGADSPVIHVFVPKSRADALARVIAAQSAARDTLEYKGVPSTAEGIEARQGMETRLTEATNSLCALVAEVIDGAKVFQGGGTERFESTLLEKVREAADASLSRLFYEFQDSDDHRWAKVIERARKGAEHPLEAVDYSGKTEDHPVCSAVLSFVGSGKKGKDVRSHFSGPPYGWSRDAVDAALIGLFGAGHLRATANGTPLKSGQLDQAKVASTDFRVESATIDTRQRLTVRKLFQTAGIACKPNEEAAAASQFLAKLTELANSAGGKAPLPERPDTSHLLDLLSLAGNEQLLGILNRHDELNKNIEAWSRLNNTADKRLPAFQRLLVLTRHAEGLDAAKVVQPQVEAIAANRSLLDGTDPVPDLAKVLADALRAALAQAEKRYSETYDGEWQRLSDAGSWRKIGEEARKRILSQLRIGKVNKGATGTEQEVLESLERISLDAWATCTAALPQLFAEARIQADKLVEPKIHHVKLGSNTLRSPEEVRAWVEETEQELIEQLKHGPIVVS